MLTMPPPRSDPSRLPPRPPEPGQLPPIREPEPRRLPDEQPLPNPDESDAPPQHAGNLGTFRRASQWLNEPMHIRDLQPHRGTIAYLFGRGDCLRQERAYR